MLRLSDFSSSLQLQLLSKMEAEYLGVEYDLRSVMEERKT